ncbi:hypothetical protein [Desulfosarcina variabilis]|uniref:hypothetical protein n=1 Tax=Desulfosarcina variabilis TaxID=2300 RepID=UPI003AFA5EBA
MIPMRRIQNDAPNHIQFILQIARRRCRRRGGPMCPPLTYVSALALCVSALISPPASTLMKHGKQGGYI